MSTSVVGFKPPDKKWREMKAIWDACKSANIEIPNQVIDFFDGQEPHEHGVIVGLKGCTKEWSADMSAGIEVEIAKLPTDVTFIRFYNSW